MALEANKKLLDAASELGRAGSLEVTVPSVGGSSVAQRVSLGPGVNPERINFKQCDPMCLPAGLAGEGGGGSEWVCFGGCTHVDGQVGSDDWWVDRWVGEQLKGGGRLE